MQCARKSKIFSAFRFLGLAVKSPPEGRTCLRVYAKVLADLDGAMSVTADEIRQASDNVRKVVVGLPVEFAMLDSCPTDALMCAIGILNLLNRNPRQKG
jgi:hypothetical protein